MRLWHFQACGCGLIVTVLSMAPAARVHHAFLDKSSEAKLVSSQTDAVPGNVVDVTAGDFFFTSPESIPAGLTTFRLSQVGKFTHDMWILQLLQNKTFEEFVALAVAGQPRPWARNLGGPGFIEPPLSTNVTLVLESGSYVLACFMTAAGDPPEHRRMFRPLHVVPAPDAASTEPPTESDGKDSRRWLRVLSLALGRSTLVTSRKRDIPKPYVPNRADSSRSNRRGGARMEAGTPDGSRNCTPDRVERTSRNFRAGATPDYGGRP